MSKPPKFPPEIRQRAFRMVYEVRESHDSQWAAIEAVAGKISCTAQTLSNGIRKVIPPRNHQRLLEPIGNIPPAELEALYEQGQAQLPMAA